MLRSIPQPPDRFLRHVLALDAYSNPDIAEGRRHRSRKTLVGARTSLAKYHGRSPLSQERSRDELSCDLCQAAAASRICAEAELVIATPGHDGSPDALSVQLGEDVAKTLGVRVVYAEARAPHAPVKNRYANLNGYYSIDEDLEGPVLIVDDVFATGGTIASVGNAALAAGAEYGIGLALAEVQL